MEYSHSDADLVQQPVGYWSWAAYKAVVSRTRAALTGLGTTQPQWWVLAQAARAERRDSSTSPPRAGPSSTKRPRSQRTLWDERHAGISDDEYLTMLKVLQRVIHNTGGHAWHH